MGTKANGKQLIGTSPQTGNQQKRIRDKLAEKETAPAAAVEKAIERIAVHERRKLNESAEFRVGGYQSAGCNKKITRTKKKKKTIG